MDKPRDYQAAKTVVGGHIKHMANFKAATGYTWLSVTYVFSFRDTCPLSFTVDTSLIALEGNTSVIFHASHIITPHHQCVQHRPAIYCFTFVVNIDVTMCTHFCFKEILGWLFTIVLAILLIVQPLIDLSSMTVADKIQRFGL